MSIFDKNIEESRVLMAVLETNNGRTSDIADKVRRFMQAEKLSDKQMATFSNAKLRRVLESLVKKSLIARGDLLLGSKGYRWTLTDAGEQRISHEFKTGKLGWTKSNAKAV